MIFFQMVDKTDYRTRGAQAVAKLLAKMPCGDYASFIKWLFDYSRQSKVSAVTYELVGIWAVGFELNLNFLPLGGVPDVCTGRVHGSDGTAREGSKWKCGRRTSLLPVSQVPGPQHSVWPSLRRFAYSPRPRPYLPGPVPGAALHECHTQHQRALLHQCVSHTHTFTYACTHAQSTKY